MWRPPQHQIDALYSEDVGTGYKGKVGKGDGYKTGRALLAAATAAVTFLAGCCSSYKPPLDKDDLRPAYLQEGPFNYAAELDCKCQELSEKGDILGDILTRAGWAFAVVNDAGEVVSAGALKTLLGEDGENFAKYAFDGTYGGRTFDEAVYGELLSLDLKGALDRIYGGEENELGGHGKLIIVGGSIAAPIVLSLALLDGKAKAAAPVVGPGSTPVDPF